MSEPHVIRTEGRTSSAIAYEILRFWKNPYFGAKPYLAAMVREDYGDDGKESIIRYALANMKTFRGEDASRLKAELKRMVKQT